MERKSYRAKAEGREVLLCVMPKAESPTVRNAEGKECPVTRKAEGKDGATPNRKSECFVIVINVKQNDMFLQGK